MEGRAVSCHGDQGPVGRLEPVPVTNRLGIKGACRPSRRATAAREISTALRGAARDSPAIDLLVRSSQHASMSSADFLLSPEVQKLLQVVFSKPREQFSINALAKSTKLSAVDVTRTLEHLTKSCILKRHRTADDEARAVSVDTSFVFYTELRRIALKSFAAAEPIRKMLRTKFKTSVMRAFILGEDDDSNVELLVVHGQLVPDQADMAAACRRLSISIGRQLTVHVISHNRYTSLSPRDALSAKLAASSAFEIIGDGDTKAKAPTHGEGLLQSARRKLAALGG